MKVMFVNLSWDYVAQKGKRHNRVWPPLSLLYCATIVQKQGNMVRVADLNAEPNTKIAEISKDFDKVFITSSTLDRWQCPNPDVKPVEELLKTLKQKEVYLIGAHGTYMPEYFLRRFRIKAVIIGEPEATVAEICSGADLKSIRGVAYLSKGKVIRNRQREAVELAILPLPDYSVLSLDKYFYELMGKNFMLFELSRGCPFKCVYCLQGMYGSKYRLKPIAKLKKEIQSAIVQYGVRNAYFIDLEFTVNKKVVEELCSWLIKNDYDFKWCCQTRADAVDKGLLRSMKRAGCTLIHYGVETGSSRIMKLINKNTTLKKIEEGIRLTKKAGIDSACFFMFGFPTETDEEMRMTIEFAKKLNPTYASFHTATLYPGTRLFEMAKSKLRLPYPEAYTKEHSLNKLKAISRKAFLEFYLRPRYIASRILSFNPVSWYRQLKLFGEFVS